MGKWGQVLEKNPTQGYMAGKTLCKCPSAEANNIYAEVLKVKSRVSSTLISSLWTDDDQNKRILEKFFKSL